MSIEHLKDWKPDYPYVKLWRSDARKMVNDGHGNVSPQLQEDVTFLRLTGCHINQETILNAKGNGWTRVLEYGNFDVSGNYVDGGVRRNRKDYGELAQWIDKSFGYEMGKAKEEAAPALDIEALKAKMRAEVEAEMKAAAEAEADAQKAAIAKAEAGAKADAEAKEAKKKAEAEAKAAAKGK